MVNKMSLNVCPRSALGWKNGSALENFSRKNPVLAGVVLLAWWLWVSHYHSSHFPSIDPVHLNYRVLIISGPIRSFTTQTFSHDGRQRSALRYSNLPWDEVHAFQMSVLESVLCSCALYLKKVLEMVPFDSRTYVKLNTLFFARRSSAGEIEDSIL
jgi:hypothetical protein